MVEARAAADAHGVAEGNNDEVTRVLRVATVLETLSCNNGPLGFENGTQGNLYGNSERFNYVADHAFDYSTYPVARFVVEFGYILIAFSEIFASITGLEYAFTKAPKNMCSLKLVMALFLLTNAFGAK
ncbi:hypothetical protein D9758_018895 [Tetrapyrgos nigripes]|uniref:Uncharacterized protein n=1 Tax=Tetrapyrgos nigripes TaxID=182062 RepID=A0A8H5B8J6_9AGAR|nr:hypothetical protein D9758_018895 [Tetrapyrgos nigripes]